MAKRVRRECPVARSGACFDTQKDRLAVSFRFRLLPTSKLKISKGDSVAFGRPLFNFQQLMGHFPQSRNLQRPLESNRRLRPQVECSKIQSRQDVIVMGRKFSKEVSKMCAYHFRRNNGNDHRAAASDPPFQNARTSRLRVHRIVIWQSLRVKRYLSLVAELTMVIADENNSGSIVSAIKRVWPSANTAILPFG